MQNEENEDDIARPQRHVPAKESLALTIVKEMEEMFLRLVFGQPVAMKLVDSQGMDSQRP